ncbi:MAG TPA: hypothetical protein VF863_00520 [Candidatus Acidoferrum sp.]
MNHQLAKIAGPTIITFALFLGGAAVHSQSGSPGRMLFAVWPGQTGKQPDSPILDPVALVTASGFDEPLKYGSAEGKEAEAIYDTFEKAYLNSGQKYPLLFGGSEIGAVDVEAAVGISCESLTATVRPSVPLPNAQRALAATSIQGLRLRTNWRQPNTTGQRSEFLNAAAAYLTKKGVTGVLPSAIKLRNLRLTKVRLDGPQRSRRQHNLQGLNDQTQSVSGARAGRNKFPITTSLGTMQFTRKRTANGRRCTKVAAVDARS